MTVTATDPLAAAWQRRLVELANGTTPGTLRVCACERTPETLLGDDAPPRRGAAVRVGDGPPVLIVDGERIGTALYEIADSNAEPWCEVIYEPTTGATQ